MYSDNENTSGKQNFSRTLSENHLKQITLLRTLSTDVSPGQNPRQYHINEIAAISGFRDEKEIQRYLFILEGQKLVEPCPAGDFTSKTWLITRRGIKAVKTISSSMTVQ